MNVPSPDLTPALAERLDQIRDQICRRFDSDAAREAIAEAIDFALSRHHGQLRKSGEPFVFHPLEVARILADEGLSPETVIAGICHDLLEDTGCDQSELRDRFGDDVALIVEGVTKINRAAPRGSVQRRKSATYRKLILAAADDARVLVVKLADRLHNVRTLQAMPAPRRRAIASETLEIYAPLAHRLGMSAIRAELEDRCLAIVDPRAYAEAGQILGSIDLTLLDPLCSLLSERLVSEGIEAEIKARVKSRYSIAEKLHRQAAAETIALEDVLGMRVIVASRDACYRVLGVVHDLWPQKSGSFDDYISVPRANLYQSLHTTVIAGGGRVLEVQIRSRDMDEVAERGIAAHWAYKEETATLRSGGPQATRRWIELAAEGQRAAAAGDDPLDEAFAALRRDVFADELYVFTPAGDVKLLPAGATAIDFAYAVHSDLGHRLTGARVDGRLWPLIKPLPAGAVVEALSSRTHEPPLDWLTAVKTNRARNRIRAFHQAELEAERTREGLGLIRSALRAAGLAPLTRGEELDRTLERAGFETSARAAADALRDRSRLRFITKRVIASLTEKPEASKAALPTTPPHPSAGAEVLVDGQSGMRTRIAGCCHPEPGDEIVGYVSLARGVTVHRNDCANITALAAAEAERLIACEWAGSERSFTTRVEVKFLDRPNLLHRLADVVYGSGAELRELDLRSGRGGVVRGHASCIVTSPRQAQELRTKLAELEGAIDVGR